MATSLPHDFAARLRTARQRAQLKQTELAQRIDVHWRTIQGWESGRIPRDITEVERAEQILGADLTTDHGPDRATPGYDQASDAQLISELAGRLADRDRTITDLRRQLADTGPTSGGPDGTVVTPDRWAARRREPADEQR